MAEPPRSRKQRREDTLSRLKRDEDTWVATADGEGGTPYLVPLSYLWEGETLLLSTLATNPTGRNLAATGLARLAIGPTRDVVMIEGTVEILEPAELPTATLEAFAEHCGFDPSKLKGAWRYYRVRPTLIQAWREANEIPGRDLMVDGAWLGDD